MMQKSNGNFIADVPDSVPREIFQILLSGKEFTLERIVSEGQATPPNEWFDQDRREWVLLLSGLARVHFEGDADAVELHPGDFIDIPAHKRHRVDWTDPKNKTVWLAVHYSE